MINLIKLVILLSVVSCSKKINYQTLNVVINIIKDYSKEKSYIDASNEKILNINISTAKLIEKNLLEPSLDSLINLLIVGKDINVFLFLAQFMQPNYQILIIDKIKRNRNFNIIDNLSYALLVDKYNLKVNNVQIYGTINSRTKIVNLDSIFYDSLIFQGNVDLKLIGINRRQLGLSPLNLTIGKPINCENKSLPVFSDLQRYILPDISNNQADSFKYLFLGKKGVPFNMKDINGNLIRFDTSVNRITLMEFWFTSCPPCITEIKVLNLVYDEFKFNPKVLIVSICRDSPEEILNFLKKHTVLYPIISNFKAYKNNYLLPGFPLTILFNNSLLISSIEIGSSVEVNDLFIRNKANKYINLINDYLSLQN